MGNFSKPTKKTSYSKDEGKILSRLADIENELNSTQKAIALFKQEFYLHFFNALHEYPKRDFLMTKENEFMLRSKERNIISLLRRDCLEKQIGWSGKTDFQ